MAQHPWEPFDNRYEIDTQSGCHVWMRLLTKDNYATMWLNGKTVSAHRYAYEQKCGTVPSGLEIDHLCRNTRCVNPDHMQAVTHIENMRRRVWRPAPQSHCRNGHLKTPENTLQRKNGPLCAACYANGKTKRLASTRRWRERQRRPNIPDIAELM